MNEIQSKIWVVDFETGWQICKAHGEFKGLSKRTVREQRSGYVPMKLWDLHSAGALTQTERETIGIN